MQWEEKGVVWFFFLSVRRPPRTTLLSSPTLFRAKYPPSFVFEEGVKGPLGEVVRWHRRGGANLGIDWRLGEADFASNLMEYD